MGFAFRDHKVISYSLFPKNALINFAAIQSDEAHNTTISTMITSISAYAAINSSFVAIANGVLKSMTSIHNLLPSSVFLLLSQLHLCKSIVTFLERFRIAPKVLEASHYVNVSVQWLE